MTVLPPSQFQHRRPSKPCPPLKQLARNLVSLRKLSASANARPSQPPEPSGPKALPLLRLVEHLKDAIGWTASLQLLPLNTLQKRIWIGSFDNVDPPGAETEG